MMESLNGIKNVWAKRILLLFVLALAIELLGFNIRSVQSLFYHEQEIPAAQMNQNGFDEYADGIYVLQDIKK